MTCRYDFGAFSNRTNALGQPIVSTLDLTVLPPDAGRLGELIATWSRVVETNGALEEAALVLAEIKDPHTIPPLAALLAKSPGNYIAVSALTGFTNDAAADALLVVLQQGEDYLASLAGGRGGGRRRGLHAHPGRGGGLAKPRRTRKASAWGGGDGGAFESMGGGGPKRAGRSRDAGGPKKAGS